MPSSELPPVSVNIQSPDRILQLADGSIFSGISFGAEGRGVAGECVFQTGKQPSQYDFGLQLDFI